MILEEKKLLVASGRTIIQCKCDYCGTEFSRPKKIILRGRKIVERDSCGSKNCRQAKREESSIRKYGQKCSLLDKGVQEKIKITNVKKYGYPHPMKNPDIMDKQKNTLLQRYNVDNPSKNKKFQHKKIETCLSKYNKTHYSKTNEYKNRVKETSLRQFGKDHYAKTEEFKSRARKTNLSKLGVEYPSQHPKVKEKILESNALHTTTYGKSQNEIKEWLEDLGIKANSDYAILGGKEIDLFNKNHQLGLEFCGLHWHHELSPEPRNKPYHHNKYKKCLDKGIMLITIFEDEWKFRNPQCKNRIKSLFGMHSQTLYARKCSLREVDKRIVSKFIEDYHVQGLNNLSVVAFGLFYNEELVAVLSLGRHPRQVSKSIITLDRLCFKDNIKILGGSKKLFQACITWCKKYNYSKIISWSDNRWSQGKIYEHLGFNLEKELGPDYSYVDIKNPKIRFSKQSQKKKRGQTKTEWELTKEKELSRIWDCGKKRWIFNLP